MIEVIEFLLTMLATYAFGYAFGRRAGFEEAQDHIQRANAVVDEIKEIIRFMEGGEVPPQMQEERTDDDLRDGLERASPPANGGGNPA